MRTHQVLDLTYHPDEGQSCFVGTFDECIAFISEQNTIGLQIVALSKEEKEIYNS
jgi:hypothetical protein